MVIGYDASRAFNVRKSGVENVSFQILTQLAKIDHKNQYLVYFRGGVKVGQDWPKNFKFQILNFKLLWTQVGLASRTFIDPLDVLFVPAHFLPLIFKPNLKTVVSIYDFGSAYIPELHSFKQKSYLHWMEKIQLKRATKIITSSYSTRNDLVSLMGVDPKRIEVIYLGVDQNFFKLVKNDLLVNSLRPYYLFVGTVQPRKNLERVIQAMTKIEDKNLVIVGSKGWMSDEIYKLPKKLGIEARVKFLGYVPDEKLPALYSQATALVYPSLFEGFGLPILEAQAGGCPVITSNLSSMPEVAGKGAIYVNPVDVNGIVKGMERVKGKGEREKLVKTGFGNVKRFSWERCAREILAVLENV